MANDGTSRARLSLNTLDTYNLPLMGSPGPQIVDYSAQSNRPTTPTSATFSSTTGGSPSRFGSAMQSPISSASRPVSWGGAIPNGRRLSVPSGGNPFTGPPGQYPPSFVTPLPSATSSTFSGQSSMYASPTASNFSESRRESNAEADWRRRTWHPGTYAGPRPATSGLGYHQTPDAPRPSFTSQPAASQTTRLPGIESFDYAPPLPPLPRRQPSPMQIDTPVRPTPARPVTYHAPTDLHSILKHQKRTSISWDTTLQKGINNLDIASSNPPSEQWSQYRNDPSSSAGIRPTTAPHSSFLDQRQPGHSPRPMQLHSSEATRPSQDPPVTPRKNKRQAWYNGPLGDPAQAQPIQVIQRTSPEDSSSSEGVPTPSNSSMAEYHPSIVHSNGYVESQRPGASFEEHKPSTRTSIMDRPHPIHGQYQQFHSHSLQNTAYRPQSEYERHSRNFDQQSSQPVANDMRRLEALVAVATGERQAVGNRP
jgi:hypothetical protein